MVASPWGPSSPSLWKEACMYCPCHSLLGTWRNLAKAQMRQDSSWPLKLLRRCSHPLHSCAMRRAGGGGPPRRA
jgi:hypothetical protein